MPTPTGLNMGWSGVGVTPTGGTLIAVDNVTSLSPGRKGSQKRFYGDTNPFPKLTMLKEKMRVVTITSGDVAKLMAMPEDVPCTIVATLNDPLNGVTAGGGALLYTFSNAIVVDNGAKGDVNEFGLASVTFECFSPTGTDPLAVTTV